MTRGLEHPPRSSGPDRFEQARVLRRRWAHDAALLGTSGTDALQYGVALGSLPQWVAIPEAARAGFAVLTGAVLRSRRLRRTLDGAVLRAVAAVIGEDRLDAVMALPGRVPERTVSHWTADPVATLHAQGGEVLMRNLEGPVALHTRLAGWFPGSDRLTAVDRQALQRIERDAWMLWTGHGDADPAMES